MSSSLDALEEDVFQLIFRGENRPAEPSPIIILGSPRTGSTILYQALCSRFDLPYISNITNDSVPATPILGFALQRAFHTDIHFSSHYGKTEGRLQPSEGSAVLKHWFGGGHPSALVSATILEGMDHHFLKTFRAIELLYEAPPVIKNAWNCFRIACIARLLPRARFIWIKRDIVAAAKSDLAARYKTQGSPFAWNSATPANFEELRNLPPAAQVVENQFEINSAIEVGLREHAAGRWTQVWYEDLLSDALDVMSQLGQFLQLENPTDTPVANIREAGNWDLSSREIAEIDAYVMRHSDRFESCVRD